MNIPPLISRTPPPIHDVVDDEDQDEEDSQSSFPSINFITSKSPDKTPDTSAAVCLDDFDYKVKSCDIRETNGINIWNEAESSDLDTFQPPVFASQKKKENPSEIVSSIYFNETWQNGKCSSSDTNSVDGNLDQNINDSICPLQNSVNNQNSVNDLHEDFSGYQSCNFDEDASEIKEDAIILKEDVTPDREIASPDSDYSCASEKALDEDRCYELDDESSIQNYLDPNNDNSKVTDVRLVEGQEATPKSLTSEDHFNDECYCVDKCSSAEISDGECESREQLNDNADSAFDDDSEFGEYKCESALPSQSTDYINQHVLSSHITSELYCVNISVTKEIDTPPVETTSEHNSFPSEEPSEDNARTIKFNEPSNVNEDSSCALNSEPVAAEFSVTFPDVVQNYQLDQPSHDCNDDDDEFSDFVECTYEQRPEPEKQPHQSLESHQVFSEDLEDQLSPILLLCLKEELTKTTVWSKLSSLEHTPALDYKWGDSYSSSRLLSALKIDSRNILSGHWTKFRKLPADDYRGHIDHIDSYPEIGFNKASVPNPQFEWVGSGLINPLDDVVSGRAKKSNNTMLSSEAENLISSFPDLSFIKQSFIVFPKNID